VNALPDPLAAELDAELRATARPERAAGEKAYLKSNLEHYGVSVPAIRSVARALHRRLPELAHDHLVALATALWDEPVHERRMLTVEILDEYGRTLRPSDLPFLERLVRESRTWALVDGLAASVVGGVVDRHPRAAATLDRWSIDADFWVRRAALLALLVPRRRGDGDFERFGRYADAMLGEKEFLIRKAIGWVLRDTARRRPTLVYEWLLARAGLASGVTVREAVKPHDEEQRREILAAHHHARRGGK
jgi:3-methyladenine DNA glycosylase AlkD